MMQAISLDFTPWPHQLPSLQARHVRYVRDSSSGDPAPARTAR